MKLSRLLLPTLLSWVACAPLVRAAIPTISAGERMQFSEEFADNRNQWSPVAVINASGSPATQNGAIKNSEWGPSIADLQSVSSTVNLKTPLKIKNGPISVYMMVRVDNADGTDSNRFGVALNEPEGAKGFIRMLTRPSASGFLEYRNEAGGGKSTEIQTARSIFQASSSPRAFKFTLIPSANGKGPATAEAFYQDPKTSKYVSLGIARDDVWLTNGELPTLTLYVRNGDNGGVWFDSIVITQAPVRR